MIEWPTPDPSISPFHIEQAVLAEVSRQIADVDHATEEIKRRIHAPGIQHPLIGRDVRMVIEPGGLQQVASCVYIDKQDKAAPVEADCKLVDVVSGYMPADRRPMVAALVELKLDDGATLETYVAADDVRDMYLLDESHPFQDDDADFRRGIKKEDALSEDGEASADRIYKVGRAANQISCVIGREVELLVGNYSLMYLGNKFEPLADYTDYSSEIGIWDPAQKITVPPDSRQRVFFRGIVRGRFCQYEVGEADHGGPTLGAAIQFNRDQKLNLTGSSEEPGQLIVPANFRYLFLRICDISWGRTTFDPSTN